MAIDPVTVFENSAISGDYAIAGDSPGSPKMLSIEVVDDGSWAGTIKLAGHCRGRAAPGAFTKFLAIKKCQDNTYIDGAVGITVAGLYLIDPTGWSIELQHVRAAGAASCYISSNNA